MGSVVPEFNIPVIRELIVHSFRIINEVRGDECHILFVFHGSRDLQRYFDLSDADADEAD